MEILHKELYKKLLQYAEKTESFLGAEVPKVIEEMITYYSYDICITLVRYILTIVALIIAVSYLISYIKSIPKKNRGDQVFFCQLAVVLCVFFLFDGKL